MTEIKATYSGSDVWSVTFMGSAELDNTPDDELTDAAWSALERLSTFEPWTAENASLDHADVTIERDQLLTVVTIAFRT